MNKLKRGDRVVVIAGNSKGTVGKLLSFSGDDRVVVEGANLKVKHVKPNPRAGVEGGLIKKEGALLISNVAIQNPVTGKPDRVGFKQLNDGQWVRVCKSNQEQIN